MHNPFTRMLNRALRPKSEIDNRQRMINNRKSKNRKCAKTAKRSRIMNRK